MDGWILREQTTHYTYMPPIMKALGCDLIRSMNWRLSYIECLGTHYNSFQKNSISNRIGRYSTGYLNLDESSIYEEFII